MEIKDFLKFTPREVKKPKDRYLSLGIRSHCKGTFIREVENPDNVMMDSLFIVKKDDLIVNITFAWEGAVALIKETDEGAFVSHRFPTYTFNRDVVIPEYFKYLIPTKRFIYELGIISPGGAGRNRVLNRKDFMHLQFVMPPIEEQKKIADILLTWDRAIKILENLIDIKIKFKKSLMKKMLTAKTVFKEFNRNKWVDYEYEKLFETVSSKKNQIAKEKYQDTGKYPIVDQGKSHIVAYTNEDKLLFSNIPVIVFGDHTRIIKLIDFPFVVGADGTQLLKTKYICDLKFGFYALCNLRLPNLGYSRHFKVVKESSFYIPLDLKEQKKIARFFLVIDQEIELLYSKLSKVYRYKKGLMQKLLTGKIRVRV